MNWTEVKAWMDANKEDAGYKQYVESVLAGAVTPDAVKKYLTETPEGKAILDSEKDKHSSKYLETWKANNLQTLVDEKVKELYPEEDPTMLEIKKLKQQLADKDAEQQKAAIKNAMLKKAQELGIPAADVLDYLVGETEEASLANLGKLEASFKAYGDKKAEEAIKSNGYTPPGGSGSGGGETKSLSELAAEANVRSRV